MRIHNWAGVPPLFYRSFHIGWRSRVAQALNQGVLPQGHYATVWSDHFADGPDPPDWIDNHVAVWSPADQIIALVALLMPDNDGRRSADAGFVRKAVRDVRRGVNLVVVDLFPADGTGVHGAIWGELTGQPSDPPADKPLTLVSYDAGESPADYFDPTAVGAPLTDMPLFLARERYIPVPLGASYAAEWAVTPELLREAVLTGAMPADEEDDR